jgi:N-formylglutamate amidohydrolase
MAKHLPLTVLHIPHASTVIPTAQRRALLLSEDEMNEELLRMTDHFTDELFAELVGEGQSVVFPVSRLVLDPERFVDDAAEPMAARGMGVIYTRGSSGQPLRAAPSPDERKRLIDAWYRPHHRALMVAVDGVLARSGVCLVLDCHSFPSVPLPYEPDQSPDRPDICLGTDATHTPAWLTELAVASFADAGFRVAVNRPFAGALVPAAHYRRDTRVIALMVEVNRGLYMDELGGQRLPTFGAFAKQLQSIVRELVRQAQSLAANS